MRIGAALIDGQWRVVSQAGDDPTIIYDPPCADKEDAIRQANLASEAFRSSLVDEGIAHWKAS